ncbi:MAG: hypothetical protein JRC68_08505 [Deltaproteobacteria bacterium]|nr:hypothetical protein [Deltaproteobacteria bacterium]
MVELHSVHCIRMKPEEADGGLPRILSDLKRLNNGEAFRPPVEDPGLSGQAPFIKVLLLTRSPLKRDPHRPSLEYKCH